MKIKLTECTHGSSLRLWGDSNFADYSHGYVTVTCIRCYRRLRFYGSGGKPPTADSPAAPCKHVAKESVSDAITRNMPYVDALCTDCGCILRHPNMASGWTEVIFNGYIIKEEDETPWL